MLWQKRPGPRMRRTFRQARFTYVSGAYRIMWHGSTHGVWTVNYGLERMCVQNTLREAKGWAENHQRGNASADR